MIKVKEQPRREAIQEISTIINSANICMLGDSVLQWPMHPESIHNQWIDDEGCIWLAANEDDYKTAISSSGGNVQLFYANALKSQFLSIFGIATLFKGSAEKTSSTMPATHKLLEHVPITLVRVSLQEAYFWDVKENDMVPMCLFKKPVDAEDDQKLCA